MSLLKGRNFYKPFTYPQFYKRWDIHEKSRWTPSEVPMNDDLNDWNNRLNDNQRNFLTNIFRFFTQGDVDVASAYYTQYLPYFKLPEVTMMMGGFAARESIHIDAYSYLLETLGMPEAMYQEFLTYEEMKSKQDYIQKFSESRHLLAKSKLTSEDKEHIAAGIALFSGFTEGMQLFSTFAMLLIFPLNGFLKGMGQIVTWSIVDETQHTDGMIELFKVFVQEYAKGEEPIRLEVLRNTVYTIAREMVNLEESFIDLVFKKYEDDGKNEENKDFFGLSPFRLKLYIKYIADKRLNAMGYQSIFNIFKNPLPELEIMINAPSHTNFFENRSTDYADGATTGSWKEIWNN